MRQKGRNLVVNSKKTAVLSLAVSVAFATLGMSLTMAVAPAQAKGSAHECTDELMHGKNYTVTKVTVKAPPEKVWSILTDYDNASKVFPQMKKCKLVQDNGNHKLVKHTIAPSGLPGSYEYTVEVKENAPHAMEWHRVSGAFKQVDGYWKLEPLDGGRTTLVTYASYVDGGFLMPQPLIKRQCRIDMPGVMTTLKAQAENNSQVHIAGRPQHNPQ